MVTKGLDFPRVTLVGVLTPDQMLYADDFRSYERTFSLITQVVGRSGRRELPGRAFLQTYQPDHPVLTAAARQDYPAFYKTEVETRRLLLYPPFCRLYCLGFWGENEAEVKRAGQAALTLLERLLPAEYPELRVRLVPCTTIAGHCVLPAVPAKALRTSKGSAAGILAAFCLSLIHISEPTRH